MTCDADWPLIFQGAKVILDPLASASWPIAIGLSIFAFRSNIRRLIDRVRSIKGAGVEAELLPEVQQGKALAAAERAANPLQAIANGDPPPHIVYSTADVAAEDLLNEFVGEDLNRRLAWAIRMRSISEVNRLHEAHYRVMFGSQLKALQRLSQHGGPALVELFRPLYEEAATNPETAQFHRGRSFEEWGSFLIAAGYVAEVQGAPEPTVELTPLGTNFLQWMVEFRVHDFRPG